MKNVLRSIALAAIATLSIANVSAGSEWRKNNKMKGESNQCSTECTAKFTRLEKAIDGVKNPADRLELKKMLHMKHCMHHKLEWLNKNMCPKCKNSFEKHKDDTCMKCEKCKHKPEHKMHKKHDHRKHMHERHGHRHEHKKQGKMRN